jgi:hypothetical protein
VTRNFGVRPHLWKGRWDDIAMRCGEVKEVECSHRIFWQGNTNYSQHDYAKIYMTQPCNGVLVTGVIGTLLPAYPSARDMYIEIQSIK